MLANVLVEALASAPYAAAMGAHAGQLLGHLSNLVLPPLVSSGGFVQCIGEGTFLPQELVCGGFGIGKLDAERCALRARRDGRGGLL
jgi:hypothetical protein